MSWSMTRRRPRGPRARSRRRHWPCAKRRGLSAAASIPVVTSKGMIGSFGHIYPGTSSRGSLTRLRDCVYCPSFRRPPLGSVYFLLSLGLLLGAAAPAPNTDRDLKHMAEKYGILIHTASGIGVLHQLTGVIGRHDGNIVSIDAGIQRSGDARIYLEVESRDDPRRRWSTTFDRCPSCATPAPSTRSARSMASASLSWGAAHRSGRSRSAPFPGRPPQHSWRAHLGRHDPAGRRAGRWPMRFALSPNFPRALRFGAGRRTDGRGDRARPCARFGGRACWL